MLGLVQTEDQGFVSIKAIKGARRASADIRRPPYYALQGDTGERIGKLSEWDFFALSARPVQLVPAEPGLHLTAVYPIGAPDEEPSVFREPILAWALCVDGNMRPVLPSGVAKGANPDASRTCARSEYVEYPDGKFYPFVDPDLSGPYDTLEAVLAEERARAEERAQRSAAALAARGAQS